MSVNGDHKSELNNLNSSEADVLMNGHLPSIEPISSGEISAITCDDKPDRLKIVQLYNEMCKVLSDDVQELVETNSESKSARIRKNFLDLQTIHDDMHRVFVPSGQTATTSEQSNVNSDQLMQQPTDQINVSVHQDPKPSDKTDSKLEADLAASSTVTAPSTLVESTCPSKSNDVEMVDARSEDAELAGQQHNRKPDEAVILLDD